MFLIMQLNTTLKENLFLQENGMESQKHTEKVEPNIMNSLENLLKRLKKILKKYQNSDDQGDHIKSIEDIELEIRTLKDDIDNLYDMINPEPPELMSLDNVDYDITIQITQEIYDKLLRYVENKDNLFIGIS